MATELTPYSTAVPLLSTAMKPTWVPDDLDVERIASYQLYEQIYWTVPDTLKLVARGYEDKPIYVPTGRTIVDTTHRYTAPGFKFGAVARLDSQQTDTTAAQQFFLDLFRREEFYTRFTGNKRFGLIRGDWCFHITADDTRPEGSRISITTIDPGSYFPIPHDDDVDKIIGCHVVNTIKVGNDTKIHRLTYRKTLDANGNPDGKGITVEEGIFKLDKWGGPTDAPERKIRDVTPLPPSITALPVYHIKNFEEPQNPFGSSELRGFERIMAAVNQAISDEELALALEGLGMYETDAPPPKRDGKEINWELGPGRVVEHPMGTNWRRVAGVGSVTPMQDHISFLIRQLRQASATPDIAVGVVEVSIAESGIARALQLGPLLAKTEEKDGIIIDKMVQMGYDLINGWVPAYERQTFDGIDLSPIMGEKVPVDRAARFAELNSMLEADVIDTQYYREEATKLGYVFPADMAARAQKEADVKAARADPFAQRVNEELSDDVGA
jgi:hypothetical protein